MSKFGKSFLFVIMLLCIGSYAYACKPAPFVDITQPVNNFTTDLNTLAVTVTYGPYHCKHKHVHTKIELIILKIDNKKAAAYDVPKHAKDGSINFTVNISSYTEGTHVLKAFAYKDKKGKHQIAKSEPITFIIKRTPPPPEPPVVTPQSGFIHGQVIDSDTELAVSGAQLTIPGVQGGILSDAAGKFSFPTPGSGEYTILIFKEGYITSERAIRVVSTRNASVDVIYVKRLDPVVTTITNAGGAHGNAAGTLQLTFPPNALPAGVNSINVSATLYEKDRELLSPLPRTTIFTYAFKVLPDRVSFTQPVSGRLANSLGFAPGTSIPIGYYNPDTHKWEDTGAMSTVSSDGAWVDFQVTHFCGYDHNEPPYTPNANTPRVRNHTANNNHNDKVCAKDPVSSLVRLKTGELSMDHSLPSVKVLNQDFGLTFFYNSYSANPMTLMAADTELDPNINIIPTTTNIKLNIEGKTIDTFFNGVAGTVRYPYLFDDTGLNGQKLATGSYPYTMEISNNYLDLTYGTANFFGGPATGNTGVPTRGPVSLKSIINGRIVVNNQQDSPFGSGWSLNGLQRLYFDPDSAIMLTEGEGSAKTFTLKKEQKQAYLGKNLASLNYEINRVFILSSNGDGTFQEPVSYPVGSYPQAVTWGDFNKDGVCDLAVANSGSNNVSILIGNSDRTFQPAVDYAVVPSPVSVTNGYFNQDDFLDLVTVNSEGYAGTVAILLGNGDGTFQAQIVYAVGSSPQGIVTEDFNQDGLSDLATANYGSISVSVLISNGDGTFQDQITYPMGSATISIAKGDFNQDGFIDLATANYGAGSIGTVSILIGTGEGTFQNLGAFVVNGFAPYYNAGPFSMAVEDFNQDGYSDLAVQSSITYQVAVLLGKGDGTFQDQIDYPVSSYPTLVTTGDFDQDGFSDLVVGSSILLNNGNGTFQSPINYPGGIAATSFNPTLSYQNIYTSSPGEYSYILRNPDESYTRYFKNGTQVNFSQSGLHISTIDKNSNAITYSYIDTNNDGRLDALSTIALPTGPSYQFNYTSGKLSSIIDPAGRVTSFNINADGDLTRITNADNTSRSFVYNTRHLMTRKIDERGQTAEYFYDQYGAIREVFSPEREVTEVAEDGTVTTSRKTEVRKYGISNVKSLINDLPAGTGTPANPAESVQAQDVTEQNIDGKNNSWSYRTDKFGGRRAFVDPLGNTITYERDNNSNLRKLTRANGSVVNMNYDKQGNLVFTQEETTNAQTKIIYEKNFNQPIAITDPLGNITTIDYDNNGNPNKVTDSTGTITTMEYNTRGQVTKVISAFGTTLQNQTIFAYDPVTFNLTTITDPLSRSTSFMYNSAGNIEKITDANGKISTFTYDPMNRVKIARDADGKVTTYAYDNMGNLISVTDANNHTTTFTYDEQNQLTKTTNPLNKQKLYAYDINRNPSMIVTPQGAQIKLYNNPANIVEKKFLPEGVVDYTYDAEYNLTRATNADSDLNFTYDPLSRLIQAQTAVPATSISYTYDFNSNLTSMTNPTGIVTNYVYDTLNRLTGITDSSDVYISSYTYDSLNRRVEKKLPNIAAPLTTSYTYDLASQLKSITNMPANISNYYDNYDNVGNRLSMTDSAGTHNYTYDNLYRLTDSSNPSENYSYDPVGNRNPITRTYDAGNRLLENDTYTYTYDPNGNMTSKVKKIGGETTTYTYNSEDQLIGVNNNITYKYDALGRRIEKNVSGTITHYVYDGEDIIQELDGNNALVATYIHGPSIDEPIALDKAGQRYYYISDGLGSITALVDQSGNIAQTYRYNSFGNIISQTGSLSQPFTYTGREYDPETGLFYYRARYYDPHSGRFLQEDPIKGLLSCPETQNHYAYALNNPVAFTDPSGKAVPLFVLIAGVGGTIGGTIEAVHSAYNQESLCAIVFSFGRGFVAGAVGSLAGIGIGAVSANPYLIGAGGSFAYDITLQSFDNGLHLSKYNSGSLIVSSVVGGAVGPLAKYVPGLQTAGRIPSLFSTRIGANSLRLMGQEAFSGISSEAVTQNIQGNNR